MAGGQPRRYETPGDLQAAIEEYFATATKLTITGLAYHLGFESRQSIYDYEELPEYSYIIRRAKLRVELGYEERLSENNVTGAIFALKNMGWKDKSETALTTPQGFTVIYKQQDGNEPINTD